MNAKVLLFSLVGVSAISLFSFTKNKEVIGVYNHFDSTKLTGPTGGKTNAPGENSCTQCHGGNGTFEISNSTVLNINFSGTGNNYIPGSTYTVTVSMVGAPVTKMGYQIVALRNSDDANIGTWNTIDGNSQIKNLGSRRYVTHTSSGNTLNTWSFDWTAPINPEGDITFYIAGLVSNNNGLSDSGDETHLKEFTIQEDASSSVIEQDIIVDIDNSLKLINNNNFITTSLVVEESNDILTSVISLNGKVVYSNYEVVNKGFNTLQAIDFNLLSKGIYIINYKIGEKLISRKVLI